MFLRALSISSLFCLLALVACGKKAENKSAPPVREADPVTSELEAQLQRQTVECEEGLSCPGSIAKIAIVDRNRLRFCTGALVNGVTLVTSASCLTAGLRSGDSDSNNRCAKDVHIFFPKFGFAPAQRVRCKSVLFANTLNGKDPTLWRSDVAYLDLDVDADDLRGRRYSRLSREGIGDRKYLTLWKVDADTNEVGVIRRSECQAVLKSYVNPLAETLFSPVITMNGCEFKPGNTGAILLGAQQRLRGILSQPLDQALVKFLNDTGRLVEPLAPMIHVSNGACMPSVIDSDVPTESECSKDLDESQMERRRGDIINSPAPFEATRLQIKDLFDKERSYFKWDVELIKEGTDYRVQAAPRCMNPVAGWISRVGRRENRFVYSMNLPDWRLTLGFDKASRVVSRLDESVKQKIYVQFSPKDANTTGATTIFVWRANEASRTFTNVRECTPLDGADESLL